MAVATQSLEELCINSIRFLAIDAVEKAKSGHPGLPMGAAPMAFVLWDRFMRFNPKNPKWFNRDRFVLSAGHGCMLQYALLHLTGYDSVTIDDIKQFRQWGSKTPGHPENFETLGVEVTTGLFENLQLLIRGGSPLEYRVDMFDLLSRAKGVEYIVDKIQQLADQIFNGDLFLLAEIE